jgi:hypothetical protein
VLFHGPGPVLRKLTKENRNAVSADIIRRQEVATSKEQNMFEKIENSSITSMNKT